MPVQIGVGGQPGFESPLQLMMDCHRRIEGFLSMLEKVVLASQGRPLSDEQRRALDAALHYFEHAAPNHTQDEEASLFPRLRQSDDPRARRLLEQVRQLEADHDTAEQLHAEVDVLGRRWLESGSLAESDVTTLAADLAQLAELYRRHIALEDQQVFPLAGELLEPAQLRAMGLEMKKRRGID